jgi:hypothetical protein
MRVAVLTDVHARRGSAAEPAGVVPALEPTREVARAGDRRDQFDADAGGQRDAHERRAGARCARQLAGARQRLVRTLANGP